MDIAVKRVYDPPEASDGFRILIDRLWPRGLTKEEARVDLWLKAIAPSSELRKWFQHDPEKWPDFKREYFAELNFNKAAVSELANQLKKGRACLLYSSKEPRYNNAVALMEYIGSYMK